MKKSIGLLMACVLSTGYAGTMGAVDPYANFGGLYLGAGTGFTTIFSHDQFSTVRSSGEGGDIDSNWFTDTAVLFTGNVGYGFMFNPQTYLGAKASLYYTPLNQTNETAFSTAAGNVLITGNNTIRRSLNPTYNIDAVLGYQLIPNIMPFVEAGVSFADVKHAINIRRSRTNIVTTENVTYETFLSLDDYKTGYNVGVGMDFLAWSSWLLSTELVYNDLGKNTQFSTTAIPGTTASETHSRTEKNNSVSLFATVSYLFSL